MIIHVRNVVHVRNDYSCAKRQQCKSWHKTLAGGESGLKAKGHNYMVGAVNQTTWKQIFFPSQRNSASKGTLRKTSYVGKVAAIHQMPDLRRFLGIINYLAKYIADLPNCSRSLRELLKEQHQRCFDELKRACSTEPTLAYYGVTKLVTLSCDSSQYGLGAVCMEGEKPLAYASRTLTDTEKRYAQIEKELLAIVYACERFHQYIYGRTVEVETDHKLLETILKKPLHQAPLRLQRMILRLQRYDLVVKYKKGALLHVADTLSRACLPEQMMETELENLTIHLVIPISHERANQLNTMTENDPTLTALRKVILKGWLRHKSDVATDIKHN